MMRIMVTGIACSSGTPPRGHTRRLTPAVDSTPPRVRVHCRFTSARMGMGMGMGMGMAVRHVLPHAPRPRWTCPLPTQACWADTGTTRITKCLTRCSNSSTATPLGVLPSDPTVGAATAVAVHGGPLERTAS